MRVTLPFFTSQNALPPNWQRRTGEVDEIRREDERFRGLEEESAPAVYVSTRQFPQTGVSLLMRHAPGREPGAAEVRAFVRRIEPRARLGRFERLTDIERLNGPRAR